MKFLKKFAVFAGIISSTMFITGCSNPTQNNINNLVKDSLNTFLDNNSVKEYRILGAENTKTRLNVYGLAKYESGSVAYTNATYNLPENYVPKKLTLESIEKIVTEHNIESLYIQEVPNHIALNDAIDYHTSVSQGFHKQNAMLLSISAPTISELKGIATFTTKTYVKTFEIPKDIDASFKPENVTDFEEYFVTSKITIRLNASEIENLKQNPNLVYEKFVEYVNNHQSDLYSISEQQIERPEYSYAQESTPTIDAEQEDAEQEMER